LGNPDVTGDSPIFVKPIPTGGFFPGQAQGDELPQGIINPGGTARADAKQLYRLGGRSVGGHAKQPQGRQQRREQPLSDGQNRLESSHPAAKAPATALGNAGNHIALFGIHLRFSRCMPAIGKKAARIFSGSGQLAPVKLLIHLSELEKYFNGSSRNSPMNHPEFTLF
jgi:hypothetical protein